MNEWESVLVVLLMPLFFAEGIREGQAFPHTCCLFEQE